jgi:hypothetical protein
MSETELIRQAMSALGRRGTGKAKARDPEKMRAAALKSWENRRKRKKSAYGLASKGDTYAKCEK